MSDRWLGPVNTVITMNAFTLLVVLLIWLPVGASTVQALFVVVVLMGVGAGSFAPLEGITVSKNLQESKQHLAGQNRC